MRRKKKKVFKTSQLGKYAPNFLTVGVYKEQIGRFRLSDYRGKKYVLLLFYPANFTILSSTELVLLNESSKDFRKLSTQIFAISIDTPFSHLQFVKNATKNQLIAFLEYPLLCDLTHTIITDYYINSSEGISFPSVFIIDKNGVIQYYSVNNFLCGINVREILRVIRSIQFVQENPGKMSAAR